MYSAPTSDILFALRHASRLSERPDASADDDLVEAIIREAGRYASEELAPAAAEGQTESAVFRDGQVTTPKGWSDLYRAWCAGGWPGLSAEEEYGGQGLPETLQAATFEIWNSSALALVMCPTLTGGAIEAIAAHGSPALRDLYLPKMIAGTWSGTMNMTEPQAGTDLAALRASAERHADGTYRIFGEKIFITYGEHDLTENIVHLVLARLPDAPAGSRGISLFLVPKFIPDTDGNLGIRNDVLCRSIEHKLGVRTSPTCTMIYGEGNFGVEKGAIGWLVGQEHNGLACMFTMMNNARLSVGVQGVAICEAATQKAIAYARDRVQGPVAGWTRPDVAPIIAHPDVARMLMTMKALTQGARAITFDCARAIHLSHTAAPEHRQFWSDRAGLLTPIAKSFPTDAGVEVASLGVQVHGGMGFIEETGAAQFYRDARIMPIYEGTNGIQAIDLVIRKLQRLDAAHLDELWGDIAAVAVQLEARPDAGFGATADRLRDALADLRDAAGWLLDTARKGDPRHALFGATPFQRLFGLTLMGAYLSRGALAVVNDGEDAARIALARFAAENLLPETAALKRAVIGGAAAVDQAGTVLGFALS